MATLIYIREQKQSASAMRGVIAYCTQEKKVYDAQSDSRLVSGVNCNGDNAFLEFMTTKEAYRKTDGIYFYQYVQSFSPNETITPKEAHEIAVAFAREAWPQSEVLVTTHCDAEHLHSHFVINSVSFETGYKLRQHPDTLKGLRALNDSICEKHGLEVLNPYENSGTKISTREYRSAQKSESWKFKMMTDIDFAMTRSGSRAEFIAEMHRLGYSVRWEDNRKYITFQNANGQKCRDIRLHEEKYRKENLQYEFQYRQSINSRKTQTEESTSCGYNRANPVSTKGVCDSDCTAGGGTQAIKRGSSVPAEALRTARRHSDGGCLTRSEGTNALYRAEEYAGDDAEERSTAGANANFHHTGWEESREIYFQLLRSNAIENETIRTDYPWSANENFEDYLDDSGLGDAPVALGLLTLLETASIIDSTEDAEEKRKKREAEENAKAFGTAVGLALSAVAKSTGKVETLTEDLEAEQAEMKMQF